jgi:hypothetical protein
MSRRKTKTKMATSSRTAVATVLDAPEVINGRTKGMEAPWKEPTVVAAVFFLLSARLFALISEYAVNIFFWDQWDFDDGTLFQKHSLWEMFRWQHGPHRQGLGALLGHFLEPLFQWNSRTESFLVGMIVVLAALCALWLKIRLFGAISYLDVCIPFIFLSPLQHETLIRVVNLAHGPLPLLLVLLYCLAWTISDTRLRYGLILLINFVTIYTGFGIFLGLITPAALVADYWLQLKDFPKGKVYAAISVLISLASLGSFFIRYIYQTAVDCSPNLLTAPWEYAKFLFLIFANLLGVQGVDFFQQVSGAIIAIAMGTALALSIRSLWMRGKAARSGEWVAALLLSYALIFTINAAYGRSCLGLVAAQESRYVIYGDLGLLGFYLFLLTIRKSRLQNAILLLLAAALSTTMLIREQDRLAMGYFSDGKKAWRSCYLSLEDIDQCTQLSRFPVYPRPEKNGLKQKLEFLKRTRLNLYSDPN